MARHSAFGIRIWSNQAIPCLTEVTGEQEELSIWVGEQPEVSGVPLLVYPPPGHPELLGTHRFVYRFADSDMMLVHYADDTRFYIDAQNRNIWTTWVEPSTIEDMATYLLGPILGYVLRRLGYLALHGSSVVIGDRAIVLVGHPGAGKSTTAAAFALRGFPVLADDVSVLELSDEGFFCVRPSYPHLRLWPKSSEILYGSASALVPITPNWNKLDVDLIAEGRPFPSSPVELRAVYLLEPRVDEPSAPRTAPIQGADLLIKLVENTYGNVLLDDAARATEFATLGRLIQTVPVQRLIPHASPDGLDDLCELLLQDAQQQIPSVGCTRK